MPRRSYDPPSDANRSRFVVRQHVFPAASIKRFYGPNDRVQVKHTGSDTVFPAKAENPIFTADRRWDQRAETGFMASIEREFQVLANGIVAGDVQHLDRDQREIVHRFYALWGLRSEYVLAKPEPIALQGCTVSRELTVEELEELELRGVVGIRPDSTIAARHIYGIRIQMNIDRLVDQALDCSWGIARSEDGEFIVPDSPFSMMVPVTPAIMLLGENPDGIVAEESLRHLNRLSIAKSRRFHFARDLSACPV